ncbi:MAG: hypothetical protein H6R00_1760 [Proteobacteria bacterium]|nr:hypothetical protein [Pseudomonadota bacterium]
MTLQDLWTAENRFWLDGPEFYEKKMAPEAHMIFPPPVGILKSEAILASLKQAPRWQSVGIDERSETASGDTVVLAPTGQRADGQMPGPTSPCAPAPMSREGWCLEAAVPSANAGGLTGACPRVGPHAGTA